MPRVVTVSESSKRDIVAQMGVDARPAAHRARRRRPGDLPADARDRAGPGPAHDHRQLRRADEGARPAARGAGQGAHRARRRRARGASASPKDKSTIPALIDRLGLDGAVRVRVGRHHRAHRRALRRGRGRGRAVALRGLLAPGDRGDGVRRAARRHHRRRAARGRRHRRRDRPARAARTTRRAGRRDPARCSATPELRARIGAAGRARVARQVHVARHRGRHGRELPRAARRATARAAR